MSVLEVALDPSTVIVAVDPGKAFNRVWISNGSGLLADPMTLSVSREGIVELELALNKHGPNAVIAIEATGSLHRPWVAELERRSAPTLTARRRISRRRYSGAHSTIAGTCVSGCAPEKVAAERSSSSASIRDAFGL